MNVEDWAALYSYWVGRGKEPSHLCLPLPITRALGLPDEIAHVPKTYTYEAFKKLVLSTYGSVAIPPDRREALERLRSETRELDEKHWYDRLQQEEESSMAKDTQTPKWKRKSYFDGTECGLSGCTKPATGYLSHVKPTKGHPQGQLWYGPVCDACAAKQGLRPTTLAELAHQRNGASDLALVLDVEVGDVLKRLEAANLQENGQPKGGSPAPQQTGLHYPADPTGTYIRAEPVEIPTVYLSQYAAYAQGVLTQLESWHIADQASMDYAAGFLKQVKGFWKELEERRLALGRPLREALDAIQAHCKPALDGLRAVEERLKRKISEGNARAEETRRQMYAEAQHAFNTGNMQGVAIATQQAVQADVSLPQGVHTRTEIKWEFQDIRQLAQEFWSWTPDPAKVQAAVDAGHRQIPGVRIWEESVVYARST